MKIKKKKDLQIEEKLYLTPNETRAFIIANMADEFDSFYKRSPRYDDYILEENLLAERALFWSSAKDILVASPIEISDDYVQWVEGLLSIKIRVINPLNNNQNLFEFLAEAEQVEILQEWVNEDSLPVSIITYAATENLAKYIELLGTKRIYFLNEYLPTQSFWVARREATSKQGFKNILKQLNEAGINIETTSYSACSTLQTSYDATLEFLSRGIPVIIKPNDGNSGIGTLRFYPKDLINCPNIKQSIYEDFFLFSNQIIVEELLISKSSETISPSLEIFIPPPPQKPILLYWSQQLISPTGGFLGIIINNTNFRNNECLDAENNSFEIASYLQNKGYRGVFDIDYVIRNDGKYIPLEFNLRRTGGTHVYMALDSLFGKTKFDYVAFSIDELSIGLSRDWKDILNSLRDLLISKDKSIGVLPININAARIGHFGFIIIANSLDDALAIQNKLELRLTTASN